MLKIDGQGISDCTYIKDNPGIVLKDNFSEFRLRSETLKSYVLKRSGSV